MKKIEVKLSGVTVTITESKDKKETAGLILDLFQKILKEFDIKDFSGLDIHELHKTIDDKYNYLADRYDSDDFGPRGSERDFTREKIEKYKFCLSQIKNFITTKNK